MKNLKTCWAPWLLIPFPSKLVKPGSYRSFQNGPLLERITLVRYQIGQDLGFVIPGVRVMDDLSLPPNQYKIEIRGTKVGVGEGYTNAY